MNPWWWLESSEDILRGVETLQYPDAQMPATAADDSGTAAGAPVGRMSADVAPASEVPSSSSSAGGEGSSSASSSAPDNPTAAANKAKKSKKAKQEAAGAEYPDFIRENNHVVRCMGRSAIAVSH
jgi:hypothetical protein